MEMMIILMCVAICAAGIFYAGKHFYAGDEYNKGYEDGMRDVIPFIEDEENRRALEGLLRTETQGGDL